MYFHEKWLFECLSSASFAQIIKPLQSDVKTVNGTTSHSISSTSDNEPELEGTLSSSSPPSHEGETLNEDEVYELEFGDTTDLSEPVSRPVAKPRRHLDRTRHASAPDMNSGVSECRDSSVNASESHDQHPTPSRSAPAPPNAVEATNNERVSYGYMFWFVDNFHISLSLSFSSNSWHYQSQSLVTNSQDMRLSQIQFVVWNQNSQ